MDRHTVEVKLAELQERFNQLNKDKSDYQQKASDIEAELFRLQGDYRTLQSLLDGDETPQDPLSITAEPEDTEVLEAEVMDGN